MASGNRDIDRLNRKLARLRESVANPKQANREVAAQLYSFVIRNFQEEGRPVGNWARLQPATIARKKKLGKEKKLVITGQLKNSFRPSHDKTTARVGSDLSYAADHQFGVPSRNLPAREMLPKPRQVLEISIKVYKNYISRETREAGFR